LVEGVPSLVTNPMMADCATVAEVARLVDLVTLVPEQR
jgi:hypothetical protein